MEHALNQRAARLIDGELTLGDHSSDTLDGKPTNSVRVIRFQIVGMCLYLHGTLAHVREVEQAARKYDGG